MKRHIKCKAVNSNRRLSIVLRPDSRDKTKWFLGTPHGAMLLNEDQMIQLANAVADLLEAYE
ncbi:hypothetical protein [Corynebacterium sp. 045007]|uniref:hypothetical protein n=1 Tax=Corynebacterium sp. 045007 TaxID=3156078 RepID=UPI00345BA1E1